MIRCMYTSPDYQSCVLRLGYAISLWIWDERVGNLGILRTSSDGRQSPTIVEPDDTGVTLLTLRGVDGRQVFQLNPQADRCLAAQTTAPQASPGP